MKQFYDNMPHGLIKTILMIIKYNILQSTEFGNQIGYLNINYLYQIFILL
jgi:hypothetical protein